VRIQGKERLWSWFGLSYASFLVLPRAGMHQMPDDWQHRMAQLLEEWDEAAKVQPDMEFFVQGRANGRIVKIPEWVLNYRRPDLGAWRVFFGRSESRGR